MFAGVPMTEEQAARWTPARYRRPTIAVVYAEENLFVADSRYVSRGVNANNVMRQVGARRKLKRGLFRAGEVPTVAHEVLAQYHGELNDEGVWKRLCKTKKDYCVIWTDDSTYLNCYDHNKSGRCLASFANSADAAIEDVAQLVGGAAAAEVDEDGHQVAARANAYIDYEEDGDMYRVIIRAIGVIMPGEEILVTYAAPRARRAEGGIYAAVARGRRW